jgi:hypothetical protein
MAGARNLWPETGAVGRIICELVHELCTSDDVSFVFHQQVLCSDDMRRNSVTVVVISEVKFIKSTIRITAI